MSTFRGVVGDVTPVRVDTKYGPLTFNLRGVNVFDDRGAQVGYFNCEDSPDDFDQKAREAGWTRVGEYVNPDGSLPLVRVGGARQVGPGKVRPERTTGEVVGSLAGNSAKLGCMLVALMVMVVFLFGVVAALFH
jgi:hypothetical protein